MLFISYVLNVRIVLIFWFKHFFFSQKDWCEVKRLFTKLMTEAYSSNLCKLKN